MPNIEGGLEVVKEEEKVEEPIVKPITNYQTLKTIKNHPLYHLLSPKQQIFLNAYLATGGDRTQAVKQAYPNQKSDLTAMKVLRGSYIRELVAIYFGYKVDMIPMNKRELLGLVSARLRNEKCNDQTFTKLVDQYLTMIERPSAPGRQPNKVAEQATINAEPEVDALVREIEAERRKKNKAYARAE